MSVLYNEDSLLRESKVCWVGEIFETLVVRKVMSLSDLTDDSY